MNGQGVEAFAKGLDTRRIHVQLGEPFPVHSFCSYLTKSMYF
jgi:hypothetical protein